MKITFSKKDKKRLHKQYRNALINVMFVVNKFHPLIIWHPSYPFQEIVLSKRKNDTRSIYDPS